MQLRIMFNNVNQGYAWLVYDQDTCIKSSFAYYGTEKDARYYGEEWINSQKMNEEEV